MEGEAEAEHVLEEDVGDGAVELVLVVAVVVAGDQVEPIRLAGRPPKNNCDTAGLFRSSIPPLLCVAAKCLIDR